jgi:acetolactate synthase I/III small subunit
MRHIISLLLRNEAGALARVASLFSTRGYNIESLSVAPTDEADIAQIGNQLSKLVDVVDITDLTLGDHIERELLLLKCQVPAEALEKIRELCRSEGARVLDDTLATYTLELTGAGGRVDALIQRVAAHAEILDVVRSGPLGIVRGQASLAAASRA